MTSQPYIAFTSKVCAASIALTAALGCHTSVKGRESPHGSARPLAAGREPMRVPSGNVVLDGELLWPEAFSADSIPIVILVHGSGRIDRDGNGPGLSCDSYKLIALGLASRGIASFRYDKRGFGRSDPDIPPEARTLDRLVDDVVAIVARLRQHPRAGRITLLGHSEGSDVVLLATPRARPDALILAGGSGRPLVDVLRTQLAAQVDESTLRAFERLIVELRAGRALDDVPAALEPLFRERSIPWLRSSLDEDPTKAASAVHVPVLVVRGEYDAQVGSEDTARLKAAIPHARIVGVPRANHLFKLESSIAFPQKSYDDPSIRLAPEAIGTIALGVAR